MNKTQKLEKYLNRAAIVLNLAERYFKDKDMTAEFARTTPPYTSQPPSLCPIHGVNSHLLPHERTRLLESWYSLSLLAILYELASENDEYKNVLKNFQKQLEASSVTDIYILWSLSTFLCEILEPISLREYLGIEDIDSPERNEGLGVG